MRLRLLTTGSSAWAVRARMALYAKGEDAEAAVELVSPGGTLSKPDYKTEHRFGRAPTLWVDDQIIQESLAIAEFFDEALPGPPLKPADPLGRARMRMLSQIADGSIINPLKPLLPNRDPNLRPPPVIESAIAAIHDGLDRLEYYIDDGGFAVGSTLTLADCTIVPTFWTVFQFIPLYESRLPLAERPKCAAYWRFAGENAVVRRILAEMDAHLAAVRAARKAAQIGEPTLGPH